MPLAAPVRSLVTTAVALLLAGTTACDPASKAAGTGGVTTTGSYSLTGIAQNDDEPCAPSTGAGCTLTATGASTIVVKGGSLSLQSNGSFTMSVNGTRNGAAAVVGTAAGTYTETATGLNLSVTGVPGTIPATWTTNRAQLIFVLPGQSVGATSGTALVVFTRTS